MVDVVFFPNLNVKLKPKITWTKKKILKVMVMCKASAIESYLQWVYLFFLCQAEEMILIGDKNGDGKIEYEGTKLQLLPTC